MHEHMHACMLACTCVADCVLPAVRQPRCTSGGDGHTLEWAATAQAARAATVPADSTAECG